MAFLPDNFEVPTLLETERFRVRPITINDVVKDYDAVMTSVEHLRSTLPWGWPPGDLTLEQDLIDLGWHQKEFQLRSSFDYAVVSLDERRLLGCVYVDPPTKKADFEAEVYLWVRADELETGLEVALEEAVRRWISEEWPFEKVIYPAATSPSRSGTRYLVERRSSAAPFAVLSPDTVRVDHRGGLLN